MAPPSVAAMGQWLLAERDQLPVWIVVAFGAGIAAWFALPGGEWPVAVIGLSVGGALLLLAIARSWTAMTLGARCLFIGLLMIAAGCAAMAWRAERVAADPLGAPWFGTLTGRIEARESIPAREMVRLVIRPAPSLGLPERVRVNLEAKHDDPGLQPGAIIQARARLMPPAQAALPGGYSFAQRAWFDRLGATGSLLDRPHILKPGGTGGVIDSLRARLSAHIQERVPGGAGGIAATLATGDRGAISEEDAEAMRASGLAHLLSISGLHVTALIGAVWLITVRILALFPPLARAWRLPLVGAGAGALAGIGYTLLTSAL